MHFKNYFNSSREWIYHRVSRRLAVWSIVFWVAAIAVLSVSVLLVGQTRTIQETAQRNTQLASIISRNISSQVNGIYADSQNFARHLEAIGTDLSGQAEAVLSLRLSATQYRAAYYFDDKGNLLFSLADSATVLQQINNSADILSRPQSAVAPEAIEAYKRVGSGSNISDVYFDPVDHTPIVYMGIPLNFGTGGSRTIVLEIDLTNIWQSLDQTTLGQSGFAYMVSRNGVIIAHPDSNYIGRQLATNLDPLLTGREGYYEYKEPYLDKMVLAAYSPVGGQLGWGIVIQQDRTEAYATITGTGVITVSIMVVLAAIGTAGIIVMTRRFTKPLVELTGQAQKIAETGDLTLKEKIVSRPDEVGQMGQAFGLMIDRLRNSENMFRNIVENSHAGIFIIDGSFHLVYANNKLAEMLGGTREDIIGHDFRDFLDAESKIMVADRDIRRQKGEEPPSRYEFGFVRRNGEHRLAELSSATAESADKKTMTIGQILDITERKIAERELKQAHDQLEVRVGERTADLTEANAQLQNEIIQRREIEDKLRVSESRYRDLVENANSIVLEMDRNGDIVYFNPFAQKFFGFTEDEILGRNVIGTIVPEIDSEGRNLTGLIKDITANPVKYNNSENENIRSNGEKVWIAWTNKGVYDPGGNLNRILSTGIDRTEQKKAAEILEEKARSEAAAAERTRLARDLHDAVSQTLFSATLIADVLPKLWEKNREEGLKRLEEIRQLTRGALAEMRTLLFELRPYALAEAELSELLRHLADSVTGRARIPVSLEIEGVCELAPDKKIALYRIAQEALNNVAKHSGATKALVSLQCQPHQVELHIIDNGRGFDVARIRQGSFGMGNMQERAAGIGATINIESKVNEGTEVIVFWQDNAGEEK